MSLGYIEITPERVAIHSLMECARHLEKVGPDNLYIVSAACSSNRALQAAFTASLAGSDNIGASPTKVRKQWIDWFEGDHKNQETRTPSFRVMSLRDLVCHAATTRMPWSNKPSSLSAIESFHLMRLSSYRDDFEHPKQLTYLLTNREVARSISITVPMVIVALGEVEHRIDDDLATTRQTALEIANLCREIDRQELSLGA